MLPQVNGQSRHLHVHSRIRTQAHTVLKLTHTNIHKLTSQIYSHTHSYTSHNCILQPSFDQRCGEISDLKRQSLYFSFPQAHIPSLYALNVAKFPLHSILFRTIPISPSFSHAPLFLHLMISVLSIFSSFSSNLPFSLPSCPL